MDRALSALNLELPRAAEELITLSESFEPFVPVARRSAAETLSMLGGLEKLASQSLAPAVQAIRAAEAAALAAQNAPAPSSAQPVSPHRPPGPAWAGNPAVPMEGSPVYAPASRSRTQASSAKPEYRPALQDSSLVEALLKLQRSRQPSARSTIPAQQYQQTTQHPPGFTPLQAPQIEVAVKQAPLSQRSPAQPRSPILRPK